MSWHYLQEEVAASWQESCLDGAPSALLKLMPECVRSCLTECAMESSTNFQSGMTSEPLMENLGMGQSMSSLAVSHAKTSASAGGGAGLDGERSGLWGEMARIIREVRPRIVLVENSPMLTSRGLGRVLGDLAGMGFDARWGVFYASTIGAAHHRARFYMVAYTDRTELEGLDFPKPIEVDPKESRRRQFARAIDATLSADDYTQMPRNPDDVARGMDGLKTTGNGWVPAVAARAMRVLTQGEGYGNKTH